MKTKYLMSLLFCTACLLTQAQTTHTIIWQMGISQGDASLTIDEGDTIEWVVNDAPHTVESTDTGAPAGFNSGNIAVGNTYSVTFTAATTFDYFCGYHPAMMGTITVLPAGGGGYCIPNYPNGCGGGDDIDDFLIPAAGFSHIGTGCSPTNYEDYTSDPSLEITLEAGEDYDFEISHGYGTQRVRIWIDFDSNEDFDHPGEMVAEEDSIGSGSGATTTEGTIEIPPTAQLGTTRMRVTTRYSSQPLPCDDIAGSAWGETHDYTVHIVAAAPSCDAPTNLMLDAITDTTADFSWDASPDEDGGYTWRVMEMGDNPETDTPVDQGTTATGVTSAQATGLMPETMYDVYVQTHCDMGVDSDFSTALSVETEAMETCDPPTDVMNDSVTETTATFSWTLSDSDADADGYVWGVFADGADPMVDNPLDDGFVSSGVATVEVAGLDDNTPYDFYMFTVCDGSANFISDIVGPINFTTDPLGLGSMLFPVFHFYPNPATHILNIETPGSTQAIELFNLRGQQLVIENDPTASLQMDVSSLAEGVYLLKITLQSGQTGYLRLVKR